MKKRFKSFIINNEFDRVIDNYCYTHWLTIKDFMKKCWLSENTRYVAKKRWSIWLRSVFKIQKVITNYDFRKLERKI